MRKYAPMGTVEFVGCFNCQALADILFDLLGDQEGCEFKCTVEPKTAADAQDSA